MSDALLHCLERLHLDDDTQLKERALRFQQQCSRLPPKVFDAGPNCKPVISIHLAFESLEKTGWDNKLAAQLATCTKAAYENTISNVRKQLNLQPTVSFNTLTIALGCTTMIKQVEALYSTFTEKYITRLSVANRQSAKEQLQQPQWKGATVYVCAKAFGETLDKSKLHALCSCSLQELNKSIKVIKDVCDTSIAELKSNTTSRRPPRPSRRTAKEETNTKPATARTSKKRKANSAKDNEGKEGQGEAETEAEEEEDAEQKQHKSSSSSKRQAKAAKDTPPTVYTAKPVTGIVSMIGRQDYRESKQYKDFVHWREAILQRCSPLNYS